MRVGKYTQREPGTCSEDPQFWKSPIASLGTTTEDFQQVTDLPSLIDLSHGHDVGPAGLPNRIGGLKRVLLSEEERKMLSSVPSGAQQGLWIVPRGRTLYGGKLRRSQWKVPLNRREIAADAIPVSLTLLVPRGSARALQDRAAKRSTVRGEIKMGTRINNLQVLDTLGTSAVRKGSEKRGEE
jgi:hypothetical protein